ncbi:MAG: (d)CMP kinase [Zetaproteobacteria bacterium]|nr:(d)CMP kinase [Zetaproteobacteria bacterium]
MTRLYWQPIEGLQIAIDGPSGSGKGTVAATLGSELGLPVLDTGLLYRFTAWQAQQADIDMDDETAVLQQLERSLMDMQWSAEGMLFSGKDCTSQLRGEGVGGLASIVAASANIRTKLLKVQRHLAQQGCVMDGRDIGSVVLPHAQGKFFLTASVRERARRRWAQLRIAEPELSVEHIAQDLLARDQRDAERECAPLSQADGAIKIDSTIMRADEVVDRMLSVLERKELIQPL